MFLIRADTLRGAQKISRFTVPTPLPPPLLQVMDLPASKNITRGAVLQENFSAQ